MIKNIRSTLKNSLIYGLGNLSTKVVGFILIPIYTKHLSVSDYGALGILEVSAMILSAFFSFGLYNGLFRWYCDKNYVHRQKAMIYTSTLFLLLIVIGMYLFMAPFAKQFSYLLFDSPDYVYILKILLISAGMEIVLLMPNTLIRIQEKPVLFTVANIIKLTTSLLFTIYFVVFLNRKIEGIYEALIIAQFVYAVYLAKYYRRNIEFKLDILVLKEMLIFSFPLALSALSSVALSITDRYALKFFGGLSDVGLYSLGYKMANTITVFIVSSVNLAIGPMIYKMIDDPNNKRFYSKLLTYYTYGLMFFILGMSLFGKEVIKFITQNPAYYDSHKVIPIISFSILFFVLRYVTIIGLQIVKKTTLMGVLVTIMSVVNLGMDVLLIPFFQSIGAAVATLSTSVIFFFVTFWYAQKYYKIPYEMAKIYKMVFIAIAIVGLAYLTNPYHLVFRIVVKTLLIASFPLILSKMNFYEPVEILALKNAWKKWHNPKNWKENLKNIKL